MKPNDDWPPRLAGKVAVITGASRGIGAAVATRFAQEGALVGVTHYPSPDMASLASGVVSKIQHLGGSAHSVPLDVTDTKSISAAIKQIRNILGPVDILVNNAMQPLRAPWTTLSPENWDAVMDVNLRGALLCCQATYADMAERRGVYIMVGSIESELGRAGGLAYVTSKAGLVGFTRSLAREIGPLRMRANLVMPGAVRTELEEEHDPDGTETANRTAGQQSIPDWIYPEHLAGTFTFLASEESAHITGQVITVDGGWLNY